MQLAELKEQLLNKTFKMRDMIFKYSSNNFLAKSYLEKINQDLKLKSIKVKSLNEILDIENNVFESTDDYLYILDTDTFKENLTQYNLNKVIVMTKKVEDEGNADLIIEFEDPKEWQIEEYLKALLPGLDDIQCKWLCSIAKYDINRLYLEANKISIFPKTEHQYMFNLLNESNMYEDLNDLTIFNFSNAIMKRDLKVAADVLRDIKNIDVEPTGLVTILYKNFKNLINIQLNSKATPDSLNMSYKQYSAIKRNVGVFSNDELIRLFNLICEVDYKLKSGILENERIVEYLVINVL